MGDQDVNKREYEAPLKSDLKSLSEVVEDVKKDFPGLVHFRVPIANSPSPSEAAFDLITSVMVGTCINTPLIISDQVGLSRATTGCVIACLFKEFQISASFEGLIETVPGVNVNCLKMDNYVDKNGTPKTGGNGIKQLRENIAESKLSYEIMDDAAQAFLKVKIMDNIHKYYYLIVFTTYRREMAEVARTTMTDEQKAALT